MDLSFTAKREQFGQDVRIFPTDAIPDDLANKAKNFAHDNHDEVMLWHRILATQGWVAPRWPAEFGGPGWDATQQFTFDEEVTRAGMPGQKTWTTYAQHADWECPIFCV